MIDWLVFNAGVTEVYGFNWFLVFEQLFLDPMMTFTIPKYLLEKIGSKTKDDIGLVFQANVFGHYYMVRSLPSKLILVKTFGHSAYFLN